MEMKIITEKENPFLKRKEIVMELKHPDSPTPKKVDLVKTIASNNSVDESQVIVDYILTKKGISESVVKLKILKEKPKVEVKPEAKQGEQPEAQASQAA